MKDKEQTKKKLIQAVGDILKKEGHGQLGVNKIAKQADVSKKLIYRYFGGLNPLLEAYIVENDYWMVFSEKMKDVVELNNDADSKHLITAVLQNQFKYFFSEKDMQRLILWELSTESPLMRSIHNARENTGQKLLQLSDLHFNNSQVNFRAIAAIIVGGIYYTVLHTLYNGSNFTDMNISSEAGQREILRAIEQIVDWAYNAAEKSNPNDQKI
jgi:AcrR family transcriptional regulator